jgi:hypothetical protein
MVDFEIKSGRYWVAAWSLPNPAIIVFRSKQVYRRATRSDREKLAVWADQGWWGRNLRPP